MIVPSWGRVIPTRRWKSWIIGCFFVTRNFRSYVPTAMVKKNHLRKEGIQFSKLDALQRRNMWVKVSDTALPPINGLFITFGTYMEALGTMGR